MTDFAIRLPSATRSAERGTPSFSLLAFLSALVERLSYDPRPALEADIGRYIQQNGGALTDEMEREIGRRLAH
ncbi:MAG: hypothetical protein SFW09_20120 [Hyphomicrobiaceae bacterium]|nr:hypothetical protein [Hyphomicrobiaceae bacterium]